MFSAAGLKLSRSVSRRQIARRDTGCSANRHSPRMVSIERLEDRTALSAGALDITFGVNGQSLTEVAGAASAHTTVIQTDGKIVVVGTTSVNGPYEFRLARYNTDGSLDTSFGDGGAAITLFGGQNAYAQDVTLQADGKIIVGGGVYTGVSNGPTTMEYALARYNTDGSLDETFGDDGIVTTEVGLGIGMAYSVAVQTDGKILAAGYATAPIFSDYTLVRYNSDGSLDTSFGNGGKASTFVGAWSSAHDMVIQADGRIVLGGSAHNTGARQNFTLTRYNTDGTLDTTYGNNGVVITTFDRHNNLTGLVLQTDGRVVASGTVYNGQDIDIALARYNVDGSLDATFGNSGRVVTDLGTRIDLAESIALQADGSILVGGSTMTGAGALVRYHADGQLDANFGTGGINHLASGYAWGLALQADGRIVTVGTNRGDSTSTIVVSRFLDYDNAPAVESSDAIVIEVTASATSDDAEDDASDSTVVTTTFPIAADAVGTNSTSTSTTTDTGDASQPEDMTPHGGMSNSGDSSLVDAFWNDVSNQLVAGADFDLN